MKLKKYFFYLLSVVMFVSFICFTATIMTVKADEELNPTTFVMTKGASIRTTPESNGLRFMAEVDEQTVQFVEANDSYSFGALIVPYDYFDKYEISAESGTDYVKTFADAQVSVSTKEGLTVSNSKKDGNYLVVCSITNLHYTNLNRDFFGIIYIVNNGQYTYASFSEGDNIRSVSDVAFKAYVNDDEDSDVVKEFFIKGYCLDEFSSEISKKEDLDAKYAQIKDNDVTSILDYYYAKGTIKLYDLLPASISDVKMLDGTVIGQVYNEYMALSESAKQIVDEKTSVNIVEMKEYYDARYVVIDAFNDSSSLLYYNNTTGDGVRVNSNYSHPEYTTLELGSDEVYGNYVNAKFSAHPTSYSHAVVSYNYADLETKLADYDYVCFYMYNANSSANALFADFGGKTFGSSTVATLNAGEWVKIAVPVADFISGTRFGVAYGLSQSVEKIYRFSGFYGVSSQVEADIIIDTIDSLKTSNFIAEDFLAINNAKSLYDSFENKSLISNSATLNKIVNDYNAKYDVVIIDDMSNPTKSGDFGNPNSLTVGKEVNAVYGNVATLSNSTAQNCAIDIAKPSQDLSGYTLHCAIYNGSSAEKATIIKYYKPGDAYYQPRVAANSWGNISIAYDTVFGDNSLNVIRIGMAGAEIGVTYKVSMVYAVIEKSTDVTDRVNALIQNINSLTTENFTGADYSQIYGLKSEYNSLPEYAKSSVTNYATLQQIESAFLAKYDVVIIDDMSNPTKSGDFGNPNSLTVGKEVNAVYGNVATLRNSAVQNCAIDIAKPSQDLSGYTLHCAIYNGSSAEKATIIKYYNTANPGGAYSQPRVAANSWGNVSIAYDTVFGDNSLNVIRIGMAGAEIGVTYKVAAVYAVKEK